MKNSPFSHLSHAARSEIGLKRKNNEDSFGAFPSVGVWCVADGMGGGDDGEIASAAVVQKVDEFCLAHPFPDGACYSGADVAAGIVDSVNAASEWIFRRADSKQLKGCGSTFVGIVFDAARPDRAIALHAGDSRLYRVRGHGIKQITKDHSAAELVGAKRDADLNPMFRGMILRAVGILRTVEVESTELSLKRGDRIVICSDGLSKMVPDSDIAAIVNAAARPSAAVDELIDAAYAAGATDNVTVEVIAIGEIPKPLTPSAMPVDATDDDPETCDTSPGEEPDCRTEGGSGDLPTDDGSVFEESDDGAVTPSTQTDGTSPTERWGIRLRRPSLPLAASLVAALVCAVAAALLLIGGRGTKSAVPRPVRAVVQTKADDESRAPAAVGGGGDFGVAKAQTESIVTYKLREQAPKAADVEEEAAAVRFKPEVQKENREDAELRSLSERLRRERAKVASAEAEAARVAERVHSSAVRLGEICRGAGALSRLFAWMESLGASCASIRSCAYRLAALKPSDDGVDAAACDLVREMQKQSPRLVERCGDAGVKSDIARFAKLDPTSLEAYEAACEIIVSAEGRERGDVRP